MYLGKPVIVLGQIYHSAFRGIYLVENIRCLSKRVRELVDCNDESATKEDAVMGLAAMYAASHPGKFGSQYALSEMSEAKNLDAIAESLKREFSLQYV